MSCPQLILIEHFKDLVSSPSFLTGITIWHAVFTKIRTTQIRCARIWIARTRSCGIRFFCQAFYRHSYLSLKTWFCYSEILHSCIIRRIALWHTIHSVIRPTHAFNLRTTVRMTIRWLWRTIIWRRTQSRRLGTHRMSQTFYRHCLFLSLEFLRFTLHWNVKYYSINEDCEQWGKINAKTANYSIFWF